MNDSSLKKIIKGCKKGDNTARAKLYSFYKETLYVLCLKYCTNIQEAEDNLQDAFISIFQNINRYNGKGSFEGWMKRIVINKAIDRYKKKGLFNVVSNEELLGKPDDNSPVYIENYLLNISLDTILRLVQELPNRYRLVFTLYQLDGYTHQEVAQLLDISVNTSKSNLHRAKLILKDQILQLNNHTKRQDKK